MGISKRTAVLLLGLALSQGIGVCPVMAQTEIAINNYSPSSTQQWRRQDNWSAPVQGGVTQAQLQGHASASEANTGKAPLTGGVSDTHMAGNAMTSQNVITTTTSVIDGYHIVNYLGLVEGAAVRQPTWNQDAQAGMQEVYGGHLQSYTDMLEEARKEAFASLLSRAKQMGANAVIGIHFDSQSFPMDKGKFSSAVVCVGTAVTVNRGK